MKFKAILFALAAVVGLAACNGCSNFQTKSPQVTVFEIKQHYDLALGVAVAYDNLPPCNPALPGPDAPPIVCAKASVVKQIKLAKDVASPAVNGAEAAVRDPNFDKSAVDAIVASANQAVIALTAITVALQVK